MSSHFLWMGSQKGLNGCKAQKTGENMVNQAITDCLSTLILSSVRVGVLMFTTLKFDSFVIHTVSG